MTENENEMKMEPDYRYVEPPELRAAGVPPLRKQIGWFAIGIAIALIIALSFAIYFYMINRH